MFYLVCCRLLPLLTAFCFFACGDNRKAQPWVSRPGSEWPQLVLTNRADFRGHTSLEGASGFLVKQGDGRILAATAAHLLGEAGGVEPEIPLDRLSGVIDSWRMYPRTMPETYVEITASDVEWNGANRPDWLFLSVRIKDLLPSHPLTPRTKPVEPGDSVYLIGCPYSEPDCIQNIYAGVVTLREPESNVFHFTVDPPVALSGFSGAPIVDSRGYLAGMATHLVEPTGSQLEAGGEDYPLMR
jgi:S1-C subfamily serine protease